MKLCFDSIDEVKDFVLQLKGSRGGKKGDADEGVQATGNAAPQPVPPPSQPQHQPQGGFPGANSGTFPGVGAQPPQHQGPTVPPEIAALVHRISTRIDGAINSGQPADQVLAWFRSQCGPEASNFSLDQIKQIALPRLAQPGLENIAKLMNA